MKRFSAMIVLLALFISFPSYGSVWKKSLAEAQAEARKKDQLMLVEMYASWCGWCKKMAQEVFPSEAFQRATENLVLLQLDTEDGEEGTKVSQDLQVRSLPTLMLLTPDMMIAGMITGYAPSKQFVQQLENSLDQWESFQEKMKRDEAGKLKPAESLELVEEIASRRGFDEAEKRFTRLSKNSDAPLNVRSEAYYQLARLQAFLGSHEEAIQSIRHLDNVAPEADASVRGQVLLAEIYFLQKDYDRALTELKKFQSEHPDSPLMENVRRLLPRVRSAAASSN